MLVVEFITRALLPRLLISTTAEGERLDFVFFKDLVGFTLDWDAFPELDDDVSPEEDLRGSGGIV